MKKRIILFLSLSLISSFIYLFAEYKFCGKLGLTIDDSWIHSVFIKNLLNGNGYSFNPGESVSGSTSPVWVFIVTILSYLVQNIFIVQKFSGIVLLFFSALYIFKLTSYLSNKTTGLFSVFIFLFNSRIAISSVSGMEILLYIFLTVSGFYYYIKYSLNTDWKQFIYVILFTVAGMSRPECFVLYIFASIHFLIYTITLKKLKTNTIIKLILLRTGVFLLLILGYFYFNYSLSSTILPTTFYAKVGERGLFYAIGHLNIKMIIGSLFVYPLISFFLWLQLLCEDNFLLLAWFLLGIYIIIKQRETKHLLFFAIFLIFHPILRGAVTNSLWFHEWGRHMANATPVFFIFSSIVYLNFVNSIKNNIYYKKYMKKILIFIIILAFICTVSYLGRSLIFIILEKIYYLTSRGKSFMEVYSIIEKMFLNLRMFLILLLLSFVFLMITIKFKLYYSFFIIVILVSLYGYIFNIDYFVRKTKCVNDINVEMGKWLKENTSEKEVIAIHDIGAIGYFSDRRIIDLVGLINNDILPYRFKKNGKNILQYLLIKKPDYLVIYPEWFPDLIKETSHFKEIYYIPVNKEFANFVKSKMSVYRCFW